jgi:Domain of unknown function (DUF5658)
VSVVPVAMRRSVWLRPVDSTTLFVALAVVFLNLVDAFGTLHHLSRGAEELNPVMGLLLHAGPTAFVVGKHMLCAAGVIGIVAHAQHRAARVTLRWVLLPVYATIAIYQLALFAFL